MVRKTVGRVLVMVLVAAAGLLVSTQAAQAFTRSEFCEREGLSISYFADNKTYLGRATFHWYAGYHTIDIYDAEPRDGAVMSARVDFGGGDVREFYTFARIDEDVYKWRAVWNGYASRWYPEDNCYPQD
ncbi:hypothetical protein OWR29_01255 [Actinoplanes sp. Pm04-4]|uniref:Secreted protein n=1 Tax=Paractinoplanes pyxinae TaxID=2997416 RepID=A0ABT4AQZ5_9ACTN|nr:hypothetical protein [Actinoplanes pyxinae]MCY1136607.1 hypothetical protein [Actinoplanes pyxinae]